MMAMELRKNICQGSSKDFTVLTLRAPGKPAEADWDYPL